MTDRGPSAETPQDFGSATSLGARERWWALLLTASLVAVTLWPVVRRPLRDSFPHSTYPMFSELREPVANIDLVVGLTAAGDDVTLSPRLIAATEEVIVAGSLVRRTVRSGDAVTAELCDTVAERVAGESSPEMSAVAEIVVRTDRLDAIGWFAGDRTPLDTTIHARCPVRR
jgi:hypothetical protein